MMKLPSEIILGVLLGQSHLLVGLDRFDEIKARASAIKDRRRSQRYEIDSLAAIVGDDHPDVIKMRDCWHSREIALGKFNKTK